MGKLLIMPSQAKNGGYEDEVITLNPQELLSKLKEKLLNGVCHFVFIKKDMSIRHAYGTLKAELIPQFKTADVEKLLKTAKDAVEVMEVLDKSENTDTLAFHNAKRYLEAELEGFGKKEKSSNGKNEDMQVYWDLEQAAFRMCTKTAVIAIYDDTLEK